MNLIIVGSVLILLLILFIFVKLRGEWIKTKCTCKRNKDCKVCSGQGFYYSWQLKK